MPIEDALSTFWWFEDEVVAGMARPGFNRTPDQARPFEWDEHVVWNWVATLETERPGPETLAQLEHWYRGNVMPFLSVPEEAGERALSQLRDRSALRRGLEHLNRRFDLLEHTICTETDLHVVLNRKRVQTDVDWLRRTGIETLVSLDQPTPHPFVREQLNNHHIPVPDLTPPTREQAEGFAEILSGALERNQPLAVHCMAGIGRTTTMITAGFLLLGRRLSELEAQIRERNPIVILKGQQWEFVHELARDLGRL